jgi:hypothetical protein
LKARWQNDLRLFGEKVFAETFASNLQSQEDFYFSRGKLDNTDDMTIRFTVQKDFYPVLFEAIKQSSPNERHWMLQASIYRRVREDTDRYALYEDEETREVPLNILIINANLASKRRNVKLNRYFVPLGNAKEEVTWLCHHLNALKKQSPHYVGQVAVVDRPGEFESLAEAVRKKLESGIWHIVHYTGHSYFDPLERVGYLLFPTDSVHRIKTKTGKTRAVTKKTINEVTIE